MFAAEVDDSDATSRHAVMAAAIPTDIPCRRRCRRCRPRTRSLSNVGQLSCDPDSPPPPPMLAKSERDIARRGANNDTSLHIIVCSSSSCVVASRHFFRLMGHFLSHKSPDLFRSGRSVLASLPYSREFLMRGGRRSGGPKPRTMNGRCASLPFLKFPLSLLSSIPLRLRKALTHSHRLLFFFLTRVSRSGRDGRRNG